MTKKQELLNWMRAQKTFASHEIARWGLDHYYLRAQRSAREFRQQGIIRKLSDAEKVLLPYKGKNAVYAIRKNDL